MAFSLPEWSVLRKGIEKYGVTGPVNQRPTYPTAPAPVPIIPPGTPGKQSMAQPDPRALLLASILRGTNG